MPGDVVTDFVYRRPTVRYDDLPSGDDLNAYPLAGHVTEFGRWTNGKIPASHWLVVWAPVTMFGEIDEHSSEGFDGIEEDFQDLDEALAFVRIVVGNLVEDEETLPWVVIE